MKPAETKPVYPGAGAPAAWCPPQPHAGTIARSRVEGQVSSCNLSAPAHPAAKTYLDTSATPDYTRTYTYASQGVVAGAKEQDYGHHTHIGVRGRGVQV